LPERESFVGGGWPVSDCDAWSVQSSGCDFENAIVVCFEERCPDVLTRFVLVLEVCAGAGIGHAPAVPANDNAEPLCAVDVGTYESRFTSIEFDVVIEEVLFASRPYLEREIPFKRIECRHSLALPCVRP
jgi:hypothetical protein